MHLTGKEAIAKRRVKCALNWDSSTQETLDTISVHEELQKGKKDALPEMLSEHSGLFPSSRPVRSVGYYGRITGSSINMFTEISKFTTTFPVKLP